jgi:hypothetical protein
MAARELKQASGLDGDRSEITLRNGPTPSLGPTREAMTQALQYHLVTMMEGAA